MNILRRYQATSYVMGTLVWTWSFWGILIASGLRPTSWIWKELFVVGLSGPLAASVGMAFVIGGKNEARRLLERVLPWRISVIRYLLALGLPAVLMLSAAALCRESLHENPEVFASSLVVLLPMFLWLLIRSGPVNEEFGWRGFLLPRVLKRVNPFTASLLVGAIWTVWHWPLWFLSGVPHSQWSFGLFGLMVLPMTFLFTWFYLKTHGSLLIAILFHGSINAAIKFIPILPPNYSSLSPFIVWIYLAWALATVIVVNDWRVWFGRVALSPMAGVQTASVGNASLKSPLLSR